MTAPSPTKMIYTSDEGTLSVLGTGAVVLQLNSEKRLRQLGFVARNQDGVLSYYKYEKEKDVFKKLNAWSINWNVLQYLPSDQSMINIKSENGIYRITKEKALKMGEFLFFKTSGIEKKIYIRKLFFDVESA